MPYDFCYFGKVAQEEKVISRYPCLLLQDAMRFVKESDLKMCFCTVLMGKKTLGKE